MKELEQFGNIPINYAILRALYSHYQSPHNKISSLEQSQQIIRLKREIYVVSPEITHQLLSTELIANHIYNPSYVSMESALRYYGLIPEQVYTTKSMTTNRSKEFENSIGKFKYITTDSDYFSIGISLKTIDNKYTFLIASPEKALCDLIISTPKLRIQSAKALTNYLEEDLRFDLSSLPQMNPSIIEACIAKGKKKDTLRFLLNLISSCH
ncbi:MAG: hypothetical protein ACK5LR_00655 [Mangrovibacterium sp.]